MLLYYDITPSQLMPDSWRILLSLTILHERRELKCGLGCFLHNYSLKKHVSDKDRKMLIPRSKDTQLILTLRRTTVIGKILVSSLGVLRSTDLLGSQSIATHEFGIYMVSFNS